MRMIFNACSVWQCVWSCAVVPARIGVRRRRQTSLVTPVAPPRLKARTKRAPADPIPQLLTQPRRALQTATSLDLRFRGEHRTGPGGLERARAGHHSLSGGRAAAVCAKERASGD